MNIQSIKETCLYFTDLGLARDFYHGKLGLPVISHIPGKHIFFRAGSSVLLCFNPEDSRTKKSPPPHFGAGKYHLAFEVHRDEYKKHKTEARALGIVITDEVTWSKGQESFYFEDPAGNVVEIVPTGIWNGDSI